MRVTSKVKFARIEDADAALVDFAREPLPFEAGFLTGKAFLAYRKRGGAKRSPMPDFSSTTCRNFVPGSASPN